MSMQNDSLPPLLSAAQMADAKTKTADLVSLLQPLMRHFDSVVIARMTRYGAKSDAFVEEADDAVAAVDADLPATFNAQEFHDAVLVMHQISEILGPLEALVQGLTECQMLVGSFLMQNSNFVYAQLKQMETLDPNVVPYVEEMKKRYERAKKSKE